jgi:hypothetical protein
VLLVGAALLVQSFWRLQRVDLGFNPAVGADRAAVAAATNLPETGPISRTTPASVLHARARSHRRAAGVEAAGGVSSLPLAGPAGRGAFTIEGRPPPSGDSR